MKIISKALVLIFTLAIASSVSSVDVKTRLYNAIKPCTRVASSSGDGQVDPPMAIISDINMTWDEMQREVLVIKEKFKTAWYRKEYLRLQALNLMIDNLRFGKTASKMVNEEYAGPKMEMVPFPPYIENYMGIQVFYTAIIAQRVGDRYIACVGQGIGMGQVLMPGGKAINVWAHPIRQAVEIGSTTVLQKQLMKELGLGGMPAPNLGSSTSPFYTYTDVLMNRFGQVTFNSLEITELAYESIDQSIRSFSNNTVGVGSQMATWASDKPRTTYIYAPNNDQFYVIVFVKAAAGYWLDMGAFTIQSKLPKEGFATSTGTGSWHVINPGYGGSVTLDDLMRVFADFK